MSLNGLQVEGADSVSNIVVTVDASLELTERSEVAEADLVLVHHGLFWGKPKAVEGSHKKLLTNLFASQTSLYATHLPLDAHAELGNNQCLAKVLELDEISSAGEYGGELIGRLGSNAKKLDLSEFTNRLEKLDGKHQVSTLAFGPKVPKKVMIVSGSAADMLYSYKEEGFDTFITGEAKQFAYHFAKEHGLNVIFAGHYATETLGVKALGKLLEDKFKVNWKFVDIPTGI